MPVRVAFERVNALRVALLLASATLAACASFAPKPIETVPFQERAQTQERDGLSVTVAVLTGEEARQLFGVDLEAKQIQPVWIKIRNETDGPLWFMHHGLDPNYYSAREAAYLNHYALRPATNRRIDEHFGGYTVDPLLEPGSETSGFVFSHLKLGTKEVRVRLFGEQNVQDFHYYVTVPGFQADWHGVDLGGIEAGFENVDLSTDQQLYDVLEALPCCTRNKEGEGKGDPVNIAVVASDGDVVLNAFVSAGWDQTELLTAGSGWKTFKAFFGGTYKYSPMSALYLFGRAQDVGLQKARDTIHQRNHLRLWMSP
jgi:hypothetical protein